MASSTVGQRQLVPLRLFAGGGGCLSDRRRPVPLSAGVPHPLSSPRALTGNPEPLHHEQTSDAHSHQGSLWFQRLTAVNRLWPIGVLFWGLSCCAFASESGGDARSVEVTGTLIPGGVECQLFQTDGGEKYTLTGDLRGFHNGDRVTLSGRIVELSHCMQGTTLSIKRIEKIGEAELQKSSPSPQSQE